MIDIENKVFQSVINKVSASFPFIRTYNDSLPAKPQFPCIALEEADNYAYERTQDSGSLENHAIVMYEVNIYSNKTSGKKDECKQIQAIVDGEFSRLGFTRTSTVPMFLNNSTIYRLVSRYTGCVSKEGEICRR